MIKPVRLFTAIAALLAVAASAHAKVTFESLLKEMTDLEALTYFPDPAYTTKQFSSYDRNSTDPKVLTDENWFANGDRGKYLREETRNGEKEYVLMDAEGPGAIVRVWSANPVDAGIVRIYLDNAEKPVVEMPLTDMLGGSVAPFINPIANEVSKGWNSYLPIPYAKHCKVTTSKWDFYYHINYRTYEKGTGVRTFTSALATEHREAIETVARALAEPEAMVSKLSGSRFDAEYFLSAGEASSNVYQAPRSAIHGMVCTVRSGKLEEVLRGSLLEITFDGAAKPQVCAPLGDFFGTAPGINPYASLSSGAMKDGVLYARWVMPFKKQCEVRVRNLSSTNFYATIEVYCKQYEWTKNSMYFHSGFRSEHPINTRPRQDWNFLDTTGKGRFVGTMLHVTNNVKDWWGEGDEKIYVDGETFPSHFGTGTEDYFGYAWCWPEKFVHAYHNQPRCDGPGNYGQTCVSRFHIIDNIPFTKSFKFDMEVWHWADTQIAMAETAWWYAFDGNTNTFAPLTADNLKVIEALPLPPPKKVEGALEGEDLKVLAKAGNPERQDFSDKMSGGAHLWWRLAKPGDTLSLAIPVEKAGKYEIFAVFTKAGDYGIHTLSINDAVVFKDLDLYNNGVIQTPEQSLGVFDLKQGENTLNVTITGKNEKAVPNYMFGLDYLRLVAK